MVEQLPGFTKKEFAMGAHGLQWKAGSTEIERVSCQARLLGVKPGWTISTINGVQIMDSQNAWWELLKCKKSGQKYEVWFMKDEASIREDQMKAEAEKEKKRKALEERKRREEMERKIQQDAEKKRADELASKKAEYWDKQNAGVAGTEAAASSSAAPAAPAEAPAEAAPPAEEGGGEEQAADGEKEPDAA
mmetsp:Transcript_98250/g.194643  ORF Transcript_98250/g.194643 Transcript_98250/m.194643 type:complete len:191 (-) Transcript_98250:145-717(-)